MRICRAAVAAATSADAPGAAGSVTTTRVYRFCTVLIASDIATCTMAKVRSLGLLPTSLATRALAITFQSVTTSARAGETNIAAATMPSSKVAAARFRTHIIGRLPLFCPRDGLSFTPGGHSHVMPVSYFILCDLWTYVTFGRAVALRAVNTLPASASKRERQDASCCLSVK